MLALRLCFGQRVAYVADIGNGLAADVQNDIAGLQALLGRRSGRIDARDHDALVARARHVIRGRERQAEMWYAARGCRFAVLGVGLLLVRHLGERHGQRLAFTLAQDVELDRALRRHWADHASESARILDRRAIDGADDIARLDSGFGGRTVGLRLVDHGALGLLHAEAFGDAGGHWLNLQAQPATRDVTVLLELRHHGLRGLRRNVETDADRAAGGRIDRRVDADHLAVDVERRSAGIAFVDGSVDLDVVVIGAGADVAAAGRDDTCGDGAPEAERIADGDHPIADPGRMIAELHVGEVVLAVDLDQSQVGLL